MVDKLSKYGIEVIAIHDQQNLNVDDVPEALIPQAISYLLPYIENKKISRKIPLARVTNLSACGGRALTGCAAFPLDSVFIKTILIGKL